MENLTPLYSSHTLSCSVWRIYALVTFNTRRTSFSRLQWHRKQVYVGGGTSSSGEFLDTERAPSNIIWTLFDYIFFRIKRALFILFKMLGGGLGLCPRFLRPIPPVPTPHARFLRSCTFQLYFTGYIKNE